MHQIHKKIHAQNTFCSYTWLAQLRHLAPRPILASVLTALLAACSTLTPDYHRPSAPVPDIWSDSASSDKGVAAVDLPWHTLFADAKLRQVVQLALDNNRDLRIAALNIEKVRAQYQIQVDAGRPHLGLSADGSAARNPAVRSPPGGGSVGHAFHIDIGISAYELDLFGRLHSLEEEALQAYFATAEARRATHLALISDVATTYMTLAANQQLVDLANDTLNGRQKMHEMQQARVRAGEMSPLTLRQSEGEVEVARVEELNASARFAKNRNALELLMGTTFPAALLPKARALPAMLSTRNIAAGLPSDLLRNRPDILAAEHVLIGANANIGAARAAFFPHISLTATAGRASNQLTDLFASNAHSWSFVPQLSLPIFDTHHLEAQLQVSKVSRELAIAQYERAIQSAFRDVNDALARHVVADEQLAAQRKRVASAQAAFDLVQQYQKSGISSYLDVLDAQRTLFTAQQSLIEAELIQQTNVVSLYKALGGGWSELSAVEVTDKLF